MNTKWHFNQKIVGRTLTMRICNMKSQISLQETRIIRLFLGSFYYPGPRSVLLYRWSELMRVSLYHSTF